MKLFHWERGRQHGGYGKMLLACGRRWDAYLIRYRTGTYVDPHLDRAPEGLRHYRLNVVLRRAHAGGEFRWSASHPRPFHTGRRLIFFRPDVTPHSVTLVESGERLVLSIGWVR